MFVRHSFFWWQASTPQSIGKKVVQPSFFLFSFLIPVSLWFQGITWMTTGLLRSLAIFHLFLMCMVCSFFLCTYEYLHGYEYMYRCLCVCMPVFMEIWNWCWASSQLISYPIPFQVQDLSIKHKWLFLLVNLLQRYAVQSENTSEQPCPPGLYVGVEDLNYDRFACAEIPSTFDLFS